MKRTLITVIPLAFLLGLLSCNKDDDNNHQSGIEPSVTNVQLRIQNNSTHLFTNTFVSSPGGEHNYGNVLPQRVSPYQVFDSVYRYAYIELMIENQTYKLQPIDYVGEKKLEPGKYTYQLQAITQNKPYHQLRLQLIKDN